MENKKEIQPTVSEKRSVVSIVFFAKKVTIREEDFISGEILREDTLQTNISKLHVEQLPELEEFLTPRAKKTEKIYALLADSKVCIVPNAIFTSKYTETYHQKNGTSEKASSIKTHKGKNSDFQIIYHFPHQLEKFLINIHPNIIIKHEADILYHTLHESHDLTLCLTYFSENQFSILLKVKGKFCFYNYFDFHKTEDLLYFTSYILKENELNIANTAVVVKGIIPSTLDKSFIEKYFGNISWPKANEDTTDFLLHNLTRCV